MILLNLVIVGAILIVVVFSVSTVTVIPRIVRGSFVQAKGCVVATLACECLIDPILSMLLFS